MISQRATGPRSDSAAPLRRLGRSAVIVPLAAVLGMAEPAFAQPLGGIVSGLGQTIGGALGQPLGATGRMVQPLTQDGFDELDQATGDVRSLAQQRALRLHNLVRANPKLLDLDEHGAPVVRSQVLAISPGEGALRIAEDAGFTSLGRQQLDELGLSLIVLEAPKGMSTKQALKQLRKLDPGGRYDYNHLYSVSGRAAAPGGAAGSEAARTDPGAARGLRLGLIDGGVDAGHPALAGAAIQQRPFAPGGVIARVHGTAVASLMVGQGGRFRGVAPGAALFAADVYGSTPAGGAADALVRALAWMAAAHVQVVNISLVGPPNVALEAAIRGLTDRGILVVAAVGNDGPAAPPLYPAAYLDVLAATGVDAHRKVLIEASRGTHVDFAAPGADMAAAGPGASFVAVRGTSFAAPIVAGELALRLHGSGPDAAREAVAELGREAVDLGPKGRDRTYGRGLVGEQVRTPPGAVGAKSTPIS